MRKNLLVLAVMAPVLVMQAHASDAPKATTQVTEKMLFADDPATWAKPKKVVPPKYPEQLLAQRVSGYVDTTVTIDDRGRVISAMISKSEPQQPQFEAAVMAVIKLWRFRESLSELCSPKEATANVRVWFEPEGDEGKISVSGAVAKQGEPFTPLHAKAINYDEVVRKVRYPISARRDGVEAALYVIGYVNGPSGLVEYASVSTMFSSDKDATKPNGNIAWVAQEAVKALKFAPGNDKDYRVCMNFQFKLQD